MRMRRLKRIRTYLLEAVAFFPQLLKILSQPLSPHVVSNLTFVLLKYDLVITLFV
jgi:hypothetical protein